MVTSGPGTIAAIAEYDGFHLGHRDLVQAARQLARRIDGVAIAVVVAAGGDTHLLPAHRRCTLAIQAGADGAVVIDADDQQSRDDLAERLAGQVRHDLGARAAVLACAPVRTPARWPSLRGALLRHGVEVYEVPRRHLDGAPVTTAALIARVQAGEVAAVAGALGRPVELEGVVARGQQLGRHLGFPTANVVQDERRVCPAYGVYAGDVTLPDGRHALAAVNVGVRPTVNGDGRPLIEVHLLDYSGDLYGCRLRVGLVQRLRGEQRFASLDALAAQIDADVRATRRALRPPPMFPRTPRYLPRQPKETE